MAKKSAKKQSYVAMLADRGYEECPIATCGRWMADLASHKTDHKTGKVGPEGRRTDRKPAEVKAWRARAAANFAGGAKPAKKVAAKREAVKA